MALLKMAAFEQWLRAILELAEREARADSAKVIDAQHVLLAMARQRESAPSRLLSAIGLDATTIHAALERELEHSLLAAGVSLRDFARAPASSDPKRAPSLGASVQQAIERGVKAAGRDVKPAHLLLGILQAAVGTVPRALALAGIDRLALIASVRQTLDNPDE